MEACHPAQNNTERLARQPHSGPPPLLQVRLNNELISEHAVPLLSTPVVPVAIPLHGLNLKPGTLSVELNLLAAKTTAALRFHEISLAQQSPLLYELLQDEGKVVQLLKRTPGDAPETAVVAKWQNTDRFSGIRAVRLEAQHTYRLGFPIAAIRGTPKLGEYRYMRLAFGLDLAPWARGASDTPL